MSPYNLIPELSQCGVGAGRKSKGTKQKVAAEHFLAQPICDSGLKPYVKVCRSVLNDSPRNQSAAKVQELPEGYEELHVGRVCLVVIKSTVRREIEKKATKEQQAGLADLVEHYGAGGPQNIPPKKYNGNEGWFPSKKEKRIRLEALKPRQLRAYGFGRQFNCRQTFFITGVDTSKKQDEADQTILRNAGTEAVRVNGLL